MGCNSVLFGDGGQGNKKTLQGTKRDCMVATSTRGPSRGAI
jgi:hypothetical protein